MYERSGIKFIYKGKCDCQRQRLATFDDKLIISCPHQPPYTIKVLCDGVEIEEITL